MHIRSRVVLCGGMFVVLLYFLYVPGPLFLSLSLSSRIVSFIFHRFGRMESGLLNFFQLLGRQWGSSSCYAHTRATEESVFLPFIHKLKQKCISTHNNNNNNNNKCLLLLLAAAILSFLPLSCHSPAWHFDLLHSIFTRLAPTSE